MAIHFIFAFLSNLHSIELSQISGCANNQDCKISTYYDVITNSQNHTTGGSEGIQILTQIGTFINYGDIKVGNGQQTFTIQSNGYIEHFINYGIFANLDKMGIWVNNTKGMSKVTNYGVMGSINYGANSYAITTPLTLNNLGLIGAKGAHIEVKNGSKVLIENYMLKISERAMTFNSFTNNDYNPHNFSHLVVNIASNNGSIAFKDENSKIILDFGNDFEFGAKYLISKIATDESGNAALGMDFSRLMPKSDIYLLSQSGEYFIANLAPQHSAIGNLYKSNIRTMNNFYVISNSMIYPRKYSKSQNLGRKISSLQHSPSLARGNSNTSPSLAEGARGWVEYPSLLDSAFSLKSYESFAYRNESQNLQTRRIQRQNKRNYSRNVKDSSLRDSAKQNRGNLPQNLNKSAESKPYYFILTPFVNYNLFFQSGRYNLSGFDYGFLTAFSAKVAESNSLGAHFMMSYGTLGDSSDKNFHISNINLNLGLNYKLDLAWDMYLKARGDVFYFLNQVKTLTMREAIKPNNLGFGASVSYGKDFDFKQGGVLGIEAGIDYKALSASEITLDSMNETYQKSLYHLLYLDLGLTYAKYFGNFGINANLGIKGNITANKLAKSQIILKNFNRSVDMILDNDKFLGYANISASYVLNHKNFDMEFSLAYYGNFGDRVISNGGGFEWRVGW